ncbi:hypothetical protein PPACK8108_LOCUS7994 [Phakopsora pachyrhizi]|uniref:Uncharacterized protein n=1 Tax=Phakopsora pachyrhizi TaxID=170000 RepID=A0AAV0AVD9_PHAPC|nr:hypothetical protein PPACK8108_LOCUS7994 [Phakopsora pachyrhizi]
MPIQDRGFYLMKGYPVFWNSQRICNVCNASITSQIPEYHSCPTTVAAGHHFPPRTAMFSLVIPMKYGGLSKPNLNGTGSLNGSSHLPSSWGISSFHSLGTYAVVKEAVHIKMGKVLVNKDSDDEDSDTEREDQRVEDVGLGPYGNKIDFWSLGISIYEERDTYIQEDILET